MTRFFTILSCYFYLSCLSAQTTSLSGIVNQYHRLLEISQACPLDLRLSTDTLKVGQRIMIYQAQGAEINISNNTQFGTPTNLNGAGLYEWATIGEVKGAGWYRLTASLQSSFVVGAAGLQVISMPMVSQDAVVTGGLTGAPFVQSTGLGGVLAIDVPGRLTLNAPVSMDGKGFEGGRGQSTQGNGCSWLTFQDNWFYAADSWRGATKGNGIAVPKVGAENGRGPQLNGGGGGNDHNSGGGGGANATEGGRGGENKEPDNLGCDGAYEGEPGKAVSLPSARIIMGGGGGAGHANNGAHTDGGTGGGIILIRAKELIVNNQPISANGTSGLLGSGDGAGGGGAGGTIVLEVTKTPQGPILLSAKGGNGGNTDNVNNNRCFGPGGGGAGGRILTNLANVISSLDGGKAGVVINSLNACNGSTNGATDGSSGVTLPIVSIVQNTQLAGNGAHSVATNITTFSLCVGQLRTVAYTTSIPNTAVSVEQLLNGVWVSGGLTDSVKVQAVSKTLIFGAFQTAGTYVFRLKSIAEPVGCFTPVYSNQISVTVTPSPTVGFTLTTNGLTLTTDNQSTNYTSLLWDFGNGTFSSQQNQSITYGSGGTYTVFLTVFSPCDTLVQSQTITVSAAASAAFVTPDTLRGCGSASITLQPGTIQTGVQYQWQTLGSSSVGGNTAQHTTSYSQSGTYTIRLIARGTNGQTDTVRRQLVVIIDQLPVAQFTSQPVSTSGVVVFTNTSLFGNSYFWTFGDGQEMLTTSSAQITHRYTSSGTYVVTLVVSNQCGASVLQTTLNLNVVDTEEDVAAIQKIRVYPNPTQGVVTLECHSCARAQVRIVDMAGRTIKHIEISEGEHVINLTGMPAGMYQLYLSGSRQPISIVLLPQGN